MTTQQQEEIRRLTAENERKKRLQKVNQNRSKKGLSSFVPTSSPGGGMIAGSGTKSALKRFMDKEISREQYKNEIATNKGKSKPKGGKTSENAPDIPNPNMAQEVIPDGVKTVDASSKFNTGVDDDGVKYEIKENKYGGRQKIYEDGRIENMENAKYDAEGNEKGKDRSQMSDLEKTTDDIKLGKERLDEDKLTFQQRIEQKKQEMKLTKEQEAQQYAGTQGGMKAAFAESQLGPTSSAAAGARALGLETAGRSHEQFLNTLDQNELALTEAEVQMERAIEDWDTNSIDAITAEIERLRDENLQIQQAVTDFENDKRTKLFDTIDSLGAEAFAMYDPNRVGEMFEQAGLDYGLGIAFNAVSRDKMEADQGKDLVAQYQASLNLEKTQADILKMSQEDRTTDQKNFDYYAKIGAVSPELAAEFANMVGITKDSVDPNFQHISVGDALYSFNPKTGEYKQVAGETPQYNVPTGVLVDSTFNGKPVTLDSAAMNSVVKINSLLVKSGMGEINIGSIADSTWRRQEDTIQRMANRFGIGFDAENPNSTAQKLRDMGHAVADVGSSMHEKGLAIDLFPDHEYIAKIKPFMEQEGWVQPYPSGDAGHFEYRGSAQNKRVSDSEATDLNKKVTDSPEAKSIEAGAMSLDSLVEFEKVFNKYGLEFIESSLVRPSYNTALLNLKEYFNLGVLNGPDLDLLEQVIPNPTKFNGPIDIWFLKGAVKNGIKDMKLNILEHADTRLDSLMKSYENVDYDQIPAMQAQINEVVRLRNKVKSSMTPEDFADEDFTRLQELGGEFGAGALTGDEIEEINSL